MNRFVLPGAIGLGIVTAVARPACASGLESSGANGPPALVAPVRPDPGAQLKAILDEHVEWIKRESPIEASTRGDLRFNHLLRDESAAANTRRLGEVVDRLARLRMIDVTGLGEADRVSADLLRYTLETYVEGDKFHGEQMPLDARSGPQVWLPQMADTIPMRTDKHRADYVSRLEALPVLIDQTIEQMRAGLAAERVPPRVAVAGAEALCLALGSADVAKYPASSPFFRPLAALPAEDPLVERAKAAIAGALGVRETEPAGIVGAYRRLGEFLRDEYLPKCRETVGISEGVDGPALYDFLLRTHTTTNLTAEEIHTIGLKEVARIREQMFRVIARTDWAGKGSYPAGSDEQFKAFVQYLRTEPRFYYTDSEALLTGYRDICKRIDAELPRLFGVLPRNTYGVREIPSLSAPVSPMGYYYPGSLKGGVPGYFVVNTYRLDQRPKYEMIALTLHESVPGHHLQIARSQELAGEGRDGGIREGQAGVHEFRTWTSFTAYTEGWALYAERLGMEMAGSTGQPPDDQGAFDAGGNGAAGPAEELGRGLFADPYDDFGRLSYEMWRACRLVVDTGIHAQGWSRERAIDYMLSNTALSPLNIEREVDRYIGWPGQACAYKIGEFKIRELRARAEKALGGRFDLREFHDCILGTGNVPLPVLEARVDRWIETSRK